MGPASAQTTQAVAAVMLCCLVGAAQADGPRRTTAVVDWNSAALAEIRVAKLGPPVVARALAIAHTCMYEAWAPYDARALGMALSLPRRPAAEQSAANKVKAVSFAAYRCLLDLFPGGSVRLQGLMAARGYDVNDHSTNPATPQGIGNLAAAAVIASRRNDGSNQSGTLNPGAYSDYTGYASRNAPMPFCLPTTAGACPLNIADPYHWQPLINDISVTQKFVAPHWERVRPFALTSAAQFDSHPALAAGPNYLQSPARLQADMEQILRVSGSIDAHQKLVVEYWADGPGSELPAGHWGLFAQHVSQRDRHTLDQDVKMFFAMHSASLDAGIATWHLKRKFDGVRPITAVRYFYQGKPVFAWGGPEQANGWIDGGKWTPYNPGSNLSPAFPGFVSGHGSFSGASAAVLRAFTGSDAFGFSTVIAPGFGRVEPNIPAVPTTLKYPTFTAAAAEAAMSRLYAGIHFADDNELALMLGDMVGRQAWAKAQFLFDGGLSRQATSEASAAKAQRLTWQHTVAPTNQRLLLVGVSTTDGRNAVQRVTYGGAPLTRLGSQNGPGSDNRVELWFAVGPAVGTAAVVVHMAQRNDVVAGAMSFSGVNPQAPFGTFRSASNDSAKACVTLANAPSPLVASVLAANGDAWAVKVGAGQSVAWNGRSNPISWVTAPWAFTDVIGVGATGPAAPMADVCESLARARRWSMVAVPLNPAFEP